MSGGATTRRAYMCTRTNSMYLYITWAMVHDAEVYRTGMTISRWGTSDEGRGASRLSLSRQARTRVAGPYSFSDFPIRLRTPSITC